MNNETFTNNLINSSIYHLLNFEKYQNFQQAARQAATNNNYQIVLFSDDFNTLFSVETKHDTTIEAAISSSFAQVQDREKKGSRVDVNGVATYWGPCMVAGNKYYLMLVDNDKKYSQEDIVKLAEIIELAMGMWNYVPLRDPSTEFIRALRRGNKELAQTLAAELKLNENDIALVFAVSGIKKKDAQKLLAKFQAEKNMTTIINVEQDEITGIVLRTPGLAPYNSEDWEDFAQKMYEQGAPKTMHVRGLYNIEDACNAFRLVGESEAFLQLIFPYRHSFSKYELVFTSTCINMCMQGGAAKKNCLDLIRPILVRTDLKSTQLKETLEVFVLDAGLSTIKTAELLDVHVNTVQYRLKRIREILGVDITSNTIVPALMSALAITRIEKEAGPL